MILIALGANLPSRYGDPLDTLEKAVQHIDAHVAIHVIKRSPVYVSAPVPISDQPWYHNAVIAVETDLEPFALLAVLQAIEADFGRVRTKRNEARVLDLDILAFNHQVLEDEGLIIPHPRMSERAFVVMPLNDIKSDWKHPITGQSVAEMLELLPKDQDIRKIEVKTDDAV